MKDLLELSQIVTSYRLDNIGAFNIFNRQVEDSLYNKFLDGILNKEFKNDEEASFKLYGSQEKDVRYRVLKKRMKERMYNNILFIDSGKRGTDAYYSNYHGLYRHYVAAKFLIGVGAKTSGYELMRKVIKKARKFQLYDIVQQCALQFRQQSMLDGNKKKFETYNKLFSETNEKLMAEAQAEEHYFNLAINLNNSLAIPKTLIQQAQQSAEITSELRKKYPTFQTYFNDYNIQTIYFQLIKDYSSAIVSCDHFLAYLERNPIFDNKIRRARINMIKASCYLHLQMYKEGISYAEKALAQYTPGTINWYLVMELNFLLALNNDQLKKATEIYNKAIEHERFGYLNQQQEMWKIYGGYLYFMLKMNKFNIQLHELEENKHTFKYSKMLNEIPHFAKDKKGMNVAVLILQVLLLLQQGKHVEIISRTDALKSYIYRNLGQDDAHRSHYFIKMLLTMEHNHFDRGKTIEKTAHYLEKLKSSHLNHSSNQARMEVIPYEKLWNSILDMINIAG